MQVPVRQAPQQPVAQPVQQARPMVRPTNMPVQRPVAAAPVAQPGQRIMPGSIGMAGNGPIQGAQPAPVAAPVSQPGVQGVNAGELGTPWANTFG